MLLWMFLLQKRLMRKYSFLVILGMVPLLTAGMFLAAKKESGMQRILLCKENEEDAVSTKIIEELLCQKSVFTYAEETSVEAAYEAVRTGKADAAWILSDGFEEGVYAYTSGHGKRWPLVTVVEREETVFLQLARERLYSVIYPYLSYALYENYITSELVQEEAVSKEELQAEYAAVTVKEGIFSFAYRNAGDQADREEETNYLLMPLRGFLLLLVLLCGMAASLYFEQDKQEQIFDRLPMGKSLFFPYIYHLPAVFDGAAVVLLTFYSTHILVSWRRELPLMALYCAACVGFCDLLRKLCGTIQRLGVCIPLLVLGMVVFCPIFINLRRFRMIQYLFPPFYYLQSLHNSHYISYFLLYTAAVYGVAKIFGLQPLHSVLYYFGMSSADAQGADTPPRS